MRPATLALAPVLLLSAALVARGAEPGSAEPAGTTGDTAAISEPAPNAEPEPATSAGTDPADGSTAGDAAGADGSTAGGSDTAAAQPGPASADPAAGVPVTELSGEDVVSGSDGEAAAAGRGHRVELGAVGYDEDGRRGHIHRVRGGDTLWDISDAYLGTPWVWPSVWQSNEAIANPHLIYPGDRIWITSTVMRRVTREEAEEMLSRSGQDGPASMQEAAEEFSEGLGRADAVPQAGLERAGVMTVSEYDASTSIVDSFSPRIWLSQGDRVFLGFADAQVGDELSIFRKSEAVYDPDTGELFGHFVNMLGWAEVTEVHSESAEAVIRESHSEMRRGDRVARRTEVPKQIVPRPTPDAVEAKIIYMPQHRNMAGHGDFVYLNRGSLHGLEAGHRLEVYRPLGYAQDRVRDTQVSLPDEIVGRLLVVASRPGTAVARVMRAETELEPGDRVRAATAPPE